MLREIETGDKKVTFVDQSLLERYRQKIQDYIAQISAFCGHYGINYHLYDTSIPFEEFLIDYLTKDTFLK